MENIIDLRSDTVTRPSEEMLSVIKNSSFSDSFLEIDSSTRALEEYCANLFNFEDAMFTVSGTISNQLAVKVHTVPGDEVLADYSYHINYYEAASVPIISGVHLNIIKAEKGIIEPHILEEILIDSNRSIYSSKIKLVFLENTINYYSGKIFPLEKLIKISNFAKANNWLVHLDGARIFNAVAEDDTLLSMYSTITDSTMISLSKCLGAPFGSILLGNKEFIQNARKYNKWLGGGLHQSGIMAELGLFAIKNNISRIKEDNNNAKLMSFIIAKEKINGLHISEVDTNIIMLDLRQLNIPAKQLIDKLSKKKIKLYEWSKYVVRAVTHMNVSKEDVEFASTEIIKTLKSINNNP